MNKILILLFFILISSCASTRVVYKYIEKDVYCIPAEQPLFPKFDYNEELPTEKNIGVLLEQLNIWRKYTGELKKEIECYKEQTNNKKVSDLTQLYNNGKEYIDKLYGKIYNK